MQNLALPTQLAGSLPPFGIELSFPQNSSCRASVLTHREPEGFVCGGNWPGGVQHFPPPRELSWWSLHLHPLLTWYLGSSWFLKSPPNGSYFFHGGLFYGSVSGGWLGTPRNSCLGLVLKKPFQWGYTIQDGVIKGGNVMFHHLPQFEDAPCQEAWLTQCRWVGFLHPILESLCIGHGLLQLFLPDIPAWELWFW